MLCVWSTRTGLGATLIRAREGGTASHCALVLPTGTALLDGSHLTQPHVLDAQPRHGVALYPLHQWRRAHRALCAYRVPLPDEQTARHTALGMLGWGYDWLRNMGYPLWREMGSAGRANCEELLLRAWMAGGLTISDRPARPTVRMLREIAHARGTPVPLEALA